MTPLPVASRFGLAGDLKGAKSFLAGKSFMFRHCSFSSTLVSENQMTFADRFRSGLAIALLLASSGSLRAQPVEPKPAVCVRIENSQLVEKYVSLLKAGAHEILDTEDYLLTSWALQRFVKLYRQEFDSRSETSDHKAVVLLTQCAWYWRNDDRLRIFRPTANEKGLKSLRERLNEIDTTSNEPQRRKLDAAGNVVSVTVPAAKIKWDTVGIYQGTGMLNQFGTCISSGCSGEEALSTGMIPILFAFTLPESEKVIQNLGDELLIRATRSLEKVQAERQAESKAQSEAEARRENEIRQEKIAATAATETKKTELAAMKASDTAILNGNWSKISSCQEVGLAYYRADQANDGITVLIQPTKRLHIVSMTLKEFRSNDLMKTAVGSMQFGETFVRFNADNTTRWFNRSQIAIGGNVVVVGRYSSNVSIALTSGASTQAAVLEAICIGNQ